MNPAVLPLDQIIQGDCIEVLAAFPENSIDLIFADPPYNLQLQQELWRPNRTRVDAVNDDWDQFPDRQAYTEFSRKWLAACQRVLKDSGTIWVIGSYHNIFLLGALMQEMGFWFLNDIIWVKTNPMPNFRGVRFTNAHETLLWACKFKGARYTFNHHTMKSVNDGLQMRSDWYFPLCSGSERLRRDGKKAHSTQKPQALLYRIILAASQPGQIVLDPFFGTGTTGAVANLLHRHWIGIEKDAGYVGIARSRIDSVAPEPYDGRIFEVRERKKELRIPFSGLLEHGLIKPGQMLYFQGNRDVAAGVRPDGNLVLNGFEGSIHQMGRHVAGGEPCNGWVCWFFEDPSGTLMPIDVLRDRLRRDLKRL